MGNLVGSGLDLVIGLKFVTYGLIRVDSGSCRRYGAFTLKTGESGLFWPKSALFELVPHDPCTIQPASVENGGWLSRSVMSSHRALIACLLGHIGPRSGQTSRSRPYAERRCRNVLKGVKHIPNRAVTAQIGRNSAYTSSVISWSRTALRSRPRQGCTRYWQKMPGIAGFLCARLADHPLQALSA